MSDRLLAAQMCMRTTCISCRSVGVLKDGVHERSGVVTSLGRSGVLYAFLSVHCGSKTSPFRVEAYMHGPFSVWLLFVNNNIRPNFIVMKFQYLGIAD